MLNHELIPALEHAVEIAAKLNTTKRGRVELTKKIRQLRDEFNIGERSAHFVKFPECDGQKVAFLLASFLRESVYGLPSDVLERDLAREQQSVGV